MISLKALNFSSGEKKGMEKTCFLVKLRCFGERRLRLDFGGGRVTVSPSSEDAFFPSYTAI